jgi:hypothetical protein
LVIKFVSQAKFERVNKIEKKNCQKITERTKRGEVKILMDIKKDKTLVPLGILSNHRQLSLCHIPHELKPLVMLLTEYLEHEGYGKV